MANWCISSPRCRRSRSTPVGSRSDTLWDEVKRFENPHNYYVDLSQKLWDIKQDLLRKNYR